MKSIAIICLMLLSSTCMAQDDAAKPAPASESKSDLVAELEALKPLLGTWVIDIKLKDGQPLWLKNKYRSGLDGNVLIVETFAKDEDNKNYQLYHAIWRWDKENEKLVSHRFQNDGTYDSSELVVTIDEEKPAITSTWARPGSPVAVQQAMKLIDEGSYHWQVVMSAASENPIMEGIWKKQD